MRVFGSRRAKAAAIGAAALAGMLVAAPAFAAAPAYHLAVTIALPSSSAHGDVVAYDPATNMVYASNPAGGLAVIDVRTDKLVTIVPLPGHVNGVAFDSQDVFAAVADNNTFNVVQKGTWKVLSSEATTNVASGATTPDSVVYDSAHQQVFVTIDDNNTVQVYNSTAPYALKQVIDLNTQVPNSSIANVGPDLGWFAPSNNTFYESDGNWLLGYNAATFANTGKVDTGLTLTGQDGKPVLYAGLKEPVYLDGQVFVGGNGTQSPHVYVATPDLQKLTTTIPVPASPDAMVANPNNDLLYGFAGGLSGKGGFFMIDATTDKVVGTVVTGGGAHTGTVNPGNGDVYVLANGSKSNPHPALLVYTEASAVAKATSPVTGVPRWPVYAGLALIALGGAAIWANRQRLKTARD